MTDTDLTQFQGQRVIVQYNLDEPNDKGETLIEVEGKAEAANALGILIKPKGRTQVELIEASKIEGVEFAPETAKKIAAKTISVVDRGKARQHLADRHGNTLEEVNALDEDAALKYHTELDHSTLGHVHGEKQSTERAEAVEEKAAEAGESTLAEPAA